MKKKADILKCLKASTKQIRDYLKSHAPVSGEKFWFFPSESKHPVVTLVCHIDTVVNRTNGKWDVKAQEWIYPDEAKRPIFYDPRCKVYWSPDGLGADDRAGVYALLTLMDRFNNGSTPNFLFCDEEESGCNGAKEAAEKIQADLRKSLFFVELDRRGSEDCVFYNNEPKDFIKYIEGFGFKEDYGSMSDIGTLGRATELCGANVSTGFYYEHTRHEHLVVDELEVSINKVESLVRDAHQKAVVWANPKDNQVKVYAHEQSYLWGGYGGEFGVGGFGARRSNYSRNGYDESYDRYRHFDRRELPASRTGESQAVVRGIVGTDAPEQRSRVRVTEDLTRHLAELREWMTAEGY